MAPIRSRQVLVWAGLPLTILFSYLWFKRKRALNQSDPGKTEKEQTKTLEEELKEAEDNSASVTPTKTFSRSLSGVDTAPIDIIFPPELKSKKSSPIVISDEDLDLEIEKIKSMKNLGEPFRKGSTNKSPSKITSVEIIRESVEQETKTPPKSIEKEASINKADIDLNASCEVSANSSIVEPIQFETIKHLETSTPKAPEVTKTLNKPINRRPKSPKSKSATKASKKAEDKSNDAQSQKMTEDIAVRDLCENSVENKLKTLHLETKSRTPKNNNVIGQEEFHRTSCDRDSANHSPADVMLASPSLSSISDNHSEGSSDSGKGGSDVVTPPPSRTPACDGSVSSDIPIHSIYEFIIPQNLVGRLIGRHGSFVTQIKEKTRAHILIRKHPDVSKLKVCQIEGTQLEIDTALEMIRDKFPEKRYPDLTLEQVSFLPPVSTVPLIPENLCLKLIEGINNDTIVSCMVSPNHLFLQQPTHPTFPNLNILSGCLNVCYSDSSSPLLPNPIPDNTVCIAHSLGAWYRALVLSTDLEAEVSYVKFLDYGGYVNIPNSELRQIRADFLSLPFQACECFLANIRPVGGEDTGWPDEAYSLVADLTKGSVIYTQVADYTEDRIPLVLIYVVVGPQSVVLLNGELVNRGFAEWIPNSQECGNSTEVTATVEGSVVEAAA